MSNNLVSHAAQLLRENPEYVADARRFAAIGNSVLGSVMSITTGAPRQYAEQAVIEALHVIGEVDRPRRRESMYVDEYLDGPAYTVGTFLAYTLSGRAAQYAGKYARALTNALDRRVEEGTVKVVSSIRGGVAYRRVVA